MWGCCGRWRLGDGGSGRGGYREKDCFRGGGLLVWQGFRLEESRRSAEDDFGVLSSLWGLERQGRAR